MKILVTGATGYVGHQLALTLAKQGNCVHIIVLPDLFSFNIPMHENIIAFTGDITDRESIRVAMDGCEQVYHTAAFVKMFAKDPAVFYKVNVEGTNNLWTEELELGVKKFVLTRTCAVIGSTILHPKSETDLRTTGFDNDYELSKFMAENLVKDYANKGLFTAIVSLSKVYGPGKEKHPFSVNKVINKFIKGKLTFIPKPGNLATNYCFIDDVVNGHILAMTKGKTGEKYILGGENISYSDLFQTIRSLSGTKAKLIETPKLFVRTWALLQWLQYKITRKEPFVTAKAINHIFCNKTFSNRKAVLDLGYKPTPLKEALLQTIQFLKTKNHV